MAKTFRKGTLHVTMLNAAMLEATAFYLPEKASETFKAGSPVLFSSGYIATASTGAVSVDAFALQDAHNGATDGLYNVKVVPASVGAALHCYGNLLTTSAADNVLAATDLGVKVQLLYGATASSSSGPMWYFGDSTSTPGFRIVSFTCDPAYIPPNQNELLAVAGDTNARVLGALLDSVADWAVT